MTNTYEKNEERLRRIAAEHGFILNPDKARAEHVMSRMAANYDQIGEWICPCKQQHRPAKKGLDKTCPCPEWLEEIADDGHCLCRLFFLLEKETPSG